MRYFAIRRKSDGLFMPAGRGWGFTKDEPTDQRPPRLFVREVGARQALRNWLAGETSVTTTRSEEFFGPEYDTEWIQVPRPDRIAADMEVVSVSVTVEPDGGVR